MQGEEEKEREFCEKASSASNSDFTKMIPNAKISCLKPIYTHIERA